MRVCLNNVLLFYLIKVVNGIGVTAGCVRFTHAFGAVNGDGRSVGHQHIKLLIERSIKVV